MTRTRWEFAVIWQNLLPKLCKYHAKCNVIASKCCKLKANRNPKKNIPKLSRKNSPNNSAPNRYGHRPGKNRTAIGTKKYVMNLYESTEHFGCQVGLSNVHLNNGPLSFWKSVQFANSLSFEFFTPTVQVKSLKPSLLLGCRAGLFVPALPMCFFTCVRLPVSS